MQKPVNNCIDVFTFILVIKNHNFFNLDSFNRVSLYFFFRKKKCFLSFQDRRLIYISHKIQEPFDGVSCTFDEYELIFIHWNLLSQWIWSMLDLLSKLPLQSECTRSTFKHSVELSIAPGYSALLNLVYQEPFRFRSQMDKGLKSKISFFFL